MVVPRLPDQDGESDGSPLSNAQWPSLAVEHRDPARHVEQAIPLVSVVVDVPLVSVAADAIPLVSVVADIAPPHEEPSTIVVAAATSN